MFKRPLSHAILLLVGFAAFPQVLALGFGRAPESIPFGQALDLSVPLRLDGSAVPPPGCLQAQVRIGEQRLPPRSVLVQLEGGDEPRVRIRSAIVVQEPMVEVQLTLGCNGAVSRQFVVFADPERQSTAGAQPAAVAAAAAAASAADRRRPSAARRPPAPQRADPAVRNEAAARPAAAAAVDEAAWASALHAASAAQAAASAAEQRLAAVTADLDRLREETGTQRALVAQMHARPARTDEPGRMLPALIAFVVSFGLVALWLGWRVYGTRHGRNVAQQLADEAVSVAGALPSPPPVQPGPPRPAPAAAIAAPAAGVDGLIDLEQEVEFFVLLGDEHAAVDLLEAHLRGGGDASPLPYLHLLQLHHRHQDRAAYAQVARRFGQRFVTDAPSWQAGASTGRDLQDCAALLAELQARWPSPVQAVAWLEQRLFSAPGSEMPGLEAYRDLLTLVAVARDLHDQAGRGDTGVDLLLPLAGGEEVAAALRPSIFDMLQPASAAPPPDAVVDVDLSEPSARR